jgi:signal transduction histidine kinase
VSAEAGSLSAPRGDENERYKAELALLRTIIATVSRSAELDQVLHLTLRTIVDWLGPGFAGLVLLADRWHQGYKVVALVGLSREAMPDRVFVDECLCQRVLESGMPIFQKNCLGAGCHTALLESREHSHLSFPLIARQSAVGTVCVFCPPGFEIDILDLSLWAEIGRLIGRAIEDASLNSQLHQQRDLLQALYDVSNHLATSLDLEWVLSRVLDLSITATEAHGGSVFLLPSAGADMPHVLRRDLTSPEADRVIGMVVDRGLAGWVVRNKKGAIVSDTSLDPRWFSFSDEPNLSGSVLAVPLMADGQVLGVLTLEHPRTARFQERHLILITAITHQASAAVEKARLYNELSAMAEILEERVEERTRELKETQAQLLHAEKLAALGELAAGVAHEINNPLHVLQAYVDYMASRVPEDDPVQEMLEPMRTSLESIAHLTAQLRDFSRPAMGERKPLYINNVLGRVLKLASKELMHSKVEVRETLASDLPPIVGDTRQLEQVFLNLMLNARDAMPGGGKLSVKTYSDPKDVYVCFVDTGVGIPTDQLTRIFEPYFTTKEDRGTGLGLAICQRVLSQHGGRISAESELGKGAVFTIQLPVALDAPDPSGNLASGEG